MQTDPIGYEDQVNLYAYVHNDPMNNFDPTGMDTENPFEEEVVVTCDCDTGSVFGGMIGNFVSAVGNILHAESTGDDSGEGSDSIPEPKGDGGVDGTEDNNIPTKHGTEREQQAKTDKNRQVGDSNKVVQGGRKYTDTDTGNTVHVQGDRVVITTPDGRKVTQFKNTRGNTRKRVDSGRWVPQ